MNDSSQTPHPEPLGHEPAPVHILAVLGSASDAVQAALGERRDFALECHDAHACACLPWQAGSRPDLILLEPPSGDQGRLAAWLADIGATSPAMPVLVLGELLSADAVRALMALQRSNVAPLPFTHAGLASQIKTLLQGPEDAQKSGARVWSLMSAVGGAGATTLAIETAFQLQSAASAPGQVVLVDLNFIDSACAAFLDVPANLRLEEVASDPGRIDAALIEAFASRHSSGFDVLVSARDLNGFAGINAEAIAALLDVCCGLYEHVVIDVSRWMQDWTLDVIAGSDAAIVVSELTVPALHAARDLACNMESAIAAEAGTVQIVLNRMAKRVFGHSITLAEAQKALGRKAAGSISSDWDGAVGAVNYGMPVGQASAKSRISKDVRALIDSLAAQMTRDGEPQPRRMAS